MSRTIALWIAVLYMAITSVGCRKRESVRETWAIAVTSSYLQAAVRDLCGDEQEVFLMAAPGMCPGHFDMSPEQLNGLLECKVFLRFDFQSGMDGVLQRLKMPVLSVSGRPGLCKPETYLSVCEELGPFLEEAGLLEAAAGRQNLEQLRVRLASLSEELKEAIGRANLTGAKAISSRHQADFARWLGLEVTGVFQSADVMTPAALEGCLRAGREHEVRFVIANLQEGTQLPENIARNLNARLVVFGNFPDTRTYGEAAFEQLLRSNVENLVK